MMEFGRRERVEVGFNVEWVQIGQVGGVAEWHRKVVFPNFHL